MLRGLYTVSTVLEQNTRALDIMSNNLASLNAVGYKRDIAQYEEFSSVLLSKMNGKNPPPVKSPAQVMVEKTVNSQVLTTENGFFKVDAAGGTSFNRSVELRVGEDGLLRTLYRNGNHEIIKDAGYAVLGKSGTVSVGDKVFEVDASGNVIVDGKVVDCILHDQPHGTLGTISGGVKLNRVVSLFEQGELRRTGNAYDLALSGKGFFTLDTPYGVRYTRNGQFKVDAENRLVTVEGFGVVGLEGPIQLSSKRVLINEYGEVIENGLAVDKLKIVNPSNVERMKKVGGSLFRFDGDMQEMSFEGVVSQGFLENSNVDNLKEMIQIMETYRAYESAQRVVKSYDDIIGKAVSEIGQL